jgi:ATP-dependent helicase/nuclease subunit B
MKTLLGPFHPHLEDALIDEVREHKSRNPLSPLLILVPSDWLRRRLKISLAIENRLNLLAVHILTFHQLYLRLFEESRDNSISLPVDDLVLEEALAHWINTSSSQSARFLSVVEKAGGCAALWQTLRDLKDGCVSAVNLSSAVDEGLFEDRDREMLIPLAELYGSFTESTRRWGLCDYTDFISSVNNTVASSSYLKQFERIFYYGFYDLTQVQLNFFNEVARHYPTTLFLPLMRGQPAWVFAQRFYERHLQGLASEEAQLDAREVNLGSLHLFAERISYPLPQVEKRPRCSVWSCSGPRDEILTVAKEILSLEHDAGMSFSEIGVVARTLEPYTDWIQEVFRDHRIPVCTSAAEPLFQSPLAKAAILLLNLAGKDYLRSHFVDLVSSPYFILPAILREDSVPRPDLWDVLTRRLGITKGADQWTRLKRYLDRDLEFSAGEENDDAEKLRVGSEQVAILWRLFMALHYDLRSLPPQASWSEYVEWWKTLLPKYLDLREEGKGDTGLDGQEVARTIYETLAALSTLDAMGAKTSLPQFVHTFQRWLEKKSVPISDRNVGGVNVLDAMAARGSRFRALFIVGLNEGLFPRTIREDAFLRDRARRVIETVLGSKVSEKLAGFEEEKLLFTLLVGAANERLYCLYQRSDETGSALEPSWYMGEIERNFSTALVAIPRSIRAKKDFEPFRRSDFLIPEELAIRLSLEAESLDSLLAHFPVAASIFQRGKKLLQRTEDPNGKLAEYDGLAGHLPEYWNRLSETGVAPTTLERYARCPFQFFALNVLGLWPLERPEDQPQVSATDEGLLIHRILKNFYQTLIDEDYFGGKRAVKPEALLETTAQKVFADYETASPTGYPLLWEVLQEEIIFLLKQTIILDLRELSQSGRRPIALEAKLHDTLPASWPAPAASLSIAGTLDRIDFDPKSSRFRVIDYKFKSGRKASGPDTHLLRAALRGERLQPPLYTLLGRAYATQQDRNNAAIEAAFYFLAPNWHGGPFSAQTFSAEAWDGSKGESLRETISFLVKGIHDGHYFIHPGPACEYCDVAQVCRKDHFPTGWRAANDPLTEPHFQLRKKTPPKEEDD